MSSKKKLYHYFYKITNIKNNKYYYGVHSTHNLDDGYMGSGVIIKKNINKYGTEFLQKDILKFFNSSDEMFAYEKQFVNEDIINDPNCYNLVGGGNGYTINHYVSQEVKNKLSKKAKNRPSQNAGKKFVTKNGKNKMICVSEVEQYLKDGWSLGIYYSEDSRKKLASNGFKGKKFTDEQRKKLSEAKKGRPANNKGIPMSEAQKELLRKLNTGKKHSEETKQKIKNIHLGSKRTEETKRKQSIAATGHIVSEETRQKISNANKGKMKGRKLSADIINKRLITNNKYEKQYGKRKAVTNGIINKFIGEKLLSEFLHNNPDFYLGITTKSK